MKISNSRNKFSSLSLLTLLVLITISTSFTIPANMQASYALNLTCQTNQQTFFLREPVTIQGTFTQDGQPVTDALIAMEVRDPRDDGFAYRTIKIGNPEEYWLINITNVSILDQENNPLTAVKTDTLAKISITVKNNQMSSLNVVIAYTMYDNTLIPIRSTHWQITLNPKGTATVGGWLYIPEWATPGKALISANAYNALPKNGGIPYIPEKIAYTYITRNEQLPLPHSTMPDSSQTQPGEYQISFRMSPDRFAQIGTYDVCIKGRISPILLTTTTTTFNMESSPCPPQAAFTYYPTKIYANMTVTFDASSSSAEGYNDTIIRYEWYFNDPNNPEHIINEGNYTNPPSPLAYHTFEYGGTYTVSLNVTDNEELWSYTIKPVTIYPEYGPTANFTSTPHEPYVNHTISFNASLSTPGWSAKTQEFSPIITYTWNFSDGTGNITVTTPTIEHNYTQPNNYIVTLTVVDAVDRTDTTSAIIQVLNVTAKIYDLVPLPDGDGWILIDDIFYVAQRFGTQEGDPNWDPRCDFVPLPDGDGKILIDDIFAIAQHFGEDP